MQQRVFKKKKRVFKMIITTFHEKKISALVKMILVAF